jgi:hypothetical protein
VILPPFVFPDSSFSTLVGCCLANKYYNEVENVLAYLFKVKNSFIMMRSVVNVIKLFSFITDEEA